MATFSNIFPAKTCPKYHCDLCDYGTSKKSSYDEHLVTKKHKKAVLATNSNNLATKTCQNLLNTCDKLFACDNCDKIFKDRTGLWRHKKKCNNNLY